ncbi:MAG: hypothetical protein IR158_02985 [Cellulomonas sp.]|uniref:hypothetical protein n=1 Tax=Cellulomonas sp. TaxID=40001 RepID=UPI001A0A1E50|nr:hypothetical protein [Cellulomonas sp.]MBF0686720.1 hypothetical protein [Cellulomonas sp.]
MIGSLVTGAREVRAPLAVGVILAAAWWFSFGKFFPAAPAATGLPEFLYRTVDVLGPSVSLAAGGFVCYLLGSILVNGAPKMAEFFVVGAQRVAAWLYIKYSNDDRPLEALRFAANGMNPLLASRWREEQMARKVSGSVGSHLRVRVERDIAQIHPTVLRVIAEEEHEAFREVVRNPAEPGMSDADVRSDLLEATLWRIDQEAPGLVVRLQVKSKELYDEWDRLSAEADLRTAVPLPLAILTAALAISWSPWFWLAGLLAPLLYAQGRGYRQRATQIVLAGLIEGVMESPTLEALNLRVEVLKHKMGVEAGV